MRDIKVYAEMQRDRAAEKTSDKIPLSLRSSVSLHKLFPYILVYLFYLTIAILITWPLVAQLTTHFAGLADSDAFEMGRNIWWVKHALQTGQSIFYQTSLGYPEGLDGSVVLWADPLQFFPAWLFAFVIPPAAAYNLAALLTMALNGWALYFLAHYLIGGRQGAALLAGVVFMAAPTFQGHLAGGHGGLMVMWPVPLFLYALFRLRDSTDRRLIILGALFFFLSPGGHLLQAIYVLLPSAVVFVVARVIQREWAWLVRGLLVMALGSIVLIAYQIPAARATFGTSAYADEGGFVRYSADLFAIVTPSFGHPLFGNLEYTHRVLGINIIEGYSYIGIMAGLLALVAVWKQRQARWWLALGLFAWICSLGPLLKGFDQPVTLTADGYDTHIVLPWAVVQKLPIFNLARAPARFNFVMALSLAVMVGYGAAYLGTRLKPVAALRISPRLILIFAIALILFEYQVFWPYPTTPAAIPNAVTALAIRDDIRAVFDIPWDNVLAAKDALYLQTGHQHPLIAGQFTRRTPVNPAKLALLQATLDPALLDAAGVDIIIVHKRYDEALAAIVRQQLGEPFFEDDRLALYEAPTASTPPQFTTLAAQTDSIINQASSYLYAPQPGWAQISGELHGSIHTAQLLVDNAPVHTWQADGEFALPIPIAEAGYHTAALALTSPCPQHFSATLECNSVGVSNLSLDSFAPASLETPIQFERGVELASAHVQQSGDSFSAWLWWCFEQPRTELDVRFVHVLDAQGKLVAQADGTLGAHPANSQWVEAVEAAADLPTGTYSIYTGWYTYPETTRFAVLSDTAGAENGLAFIGTLTIE